MKKIFVMYVIILLLLSNGYCDSLWKKVASKPNKGYISLYNKKKKEFKIHDLITIKIIEEIKANRNQRVSASKQSNFLTRLLKSFNINQDKRYIGTRTFSANLPELEVESDNSFDGQERTQRNNKFETVITAEIIEVMPNGNLVLEARRSIVVNKEKQSIIFSGVVRSKDVTKDNVVMSYNVSDAKLRYEGKGPLTNMTKKGLLSKLFDFILPW